MARTVAGASSQAGFHVPGDFFVQKIVYTVNYIPLPAFLEMAMTSAHLRPLNCLLLVLILLGLVLPVSADEADSEPVTVDLAIVGDHAILGNQLSLLVDPEGLMTAADVVAQGAQLPWQRLTETVPNLGFSSQPHWFTLRLSNSGDRTWDGLLEMSYSMLDYLDVYLVRQESVEHVAAVGDQRPFSQRALAHRHFLVPVLVPAGETVQVLLRAESSGSLKMPLEIWRLPAFFQQDQLALAPQLLFVGLMLALAIYNTFLFLSTRDWNYFWYVLSISSTCLVVSSFHGIPAQYLWPEVPLLNNAVLIGAISLTLFAASTFAYRFLDLRRLPRWVGGLVLLHSAIGAVVFFLNGFLPYVITIKLITPPIVTGSILIFCIGVWLWYKGMVLARFYTCAWFLLLAGSITISLSHMGVLPANFSFTYSQQIGAAAEGLLLSFALAYRMNLERRKRFEAQEELLRIQTEINQQLEQKVQERTAELQKANERLLEASETDGLTQVRNRRFFDTQLMSEWSKNSRQNSELSLLLIDGDHFKTINDQYGHLCGDAMLKHIAAIFHRNVKRAGDFVARYGGEEFAILLSHTEFMGAAAVAQRICDEVAKSPLEWEGQQIPFTVSIGVANRLPNRECEPAVLLQEADAALYQAKAAGRNRVMLYRKGQNGQKDSIVPYLPAVMSNPQKAASNPSR